MRIFSILVLFFLYGCKNVIPENQQAACLLEQNQDLAGQEGDSSDEIPRMCEIPERYAQSNLKIEAKLQGFSAVQEEKMKDALKRAEIAINSTYFRERVLGHTYNGVETFVSNNNLSNYEVYEKIMSGAEILNSEEDEIVNLDITLYYRNNSTVGYTYPNTNRIWVNAKFFNNFTLGKVAANAIHEWTHKIGFGHSRYNNSARPFTVPYAVGTMIEEIVDGM